MGRGLYQIGVYIELLFFSLWQTWSGNLQRTYSGKMLGTNALAATFVLCLFISFTEFSQGRENQPRNANEGVFYFELL